MELVFLALLVVLMAFALGVGFPVAFALPGSAVITICFAAAAGYFAAGDASAFFAHGGPQEWLSSGVTNLRGVYWEVERDTLIAIPLFIFMGIMLSSVYLFIIGKISIRTISKIANIPNNILYPAVLVLCIYGAYAINSNVFDVLVMFLVGILGFAMLRLDIPAAPFLIAFILGPLLEDNFRQALLMSEGTATIFFRNEICAVFWTLTCLSVFLMVRNHIRAKRPRGRTTD